MGGGRGRWVYKVLMKENLSGSLRVEPDQVMDSWLAKSPLRSQTTHRVASGLGIAATTQT